MGWGSGLQEKKYSGTFISLLSGRGCNMTNLLLLGAPHLPCLDRQYSPEPWAHINCPLLMLLLSVVRQVNNAVGYIYDVKTLTGSGKGREHSLVFKIKLFSLTQGRAICRSEFKSCLTVGYFMTLFYLITDYHPEWEICWALKPVPEWEIPLDWRQRWTKCVILVLVL